MAGGEVRFGLDLAGWAHLGGAGAALCDMDGLVQERRFGYPEIETWRDSD
jgi:hypothetical protein